MLLEIGFQPFLNLPREAIESLWLSYNLIGEGWALMEEDLQLIVGNATYLADKLGITPDHVTNLFACMDTDRNDLVDALEIMSTLGIVMISLISTKCHLNSIISSFQPSFLVWIQLKSFILFSVYSISLPVVNLPRKQRVCLFVQVTELYWKDVILSPLLLCTLSSLN